jgi:hypothetical protein
MNSIPKYVVSTTLKELEWNNSHLIKGNIAEEVARLKQQEGKSETLRRDVDEFLATVRAA